MEKVATGWRSPMKYDTIIIGGGIAGLQTAIQLGRCLRKVLVVDIPGGRSAVAKGYRNILGHSERVSGETLRQLGMEQAIQYGAMTKIAEVAKVLPCGDEGFQVWLKGEDDPLVARTLVVATGIRDPFPPVQGVRECLGISVFICPDCDGYESVDTFTAIIGDGQHALEMTRDLSFFTRKLIVINHTGAEPGQDQLSSFLTPEMAYLNDRVEQLIHQQGELQEILFTSKRRVKVNRAFLAFPGAQVQSQLLSGTRVHVDEKGHVLVNPRTKETDHPNIWAVGDVVNHSQQVCIAMGDGVQAAIWVHKRLKQMDEETFLGKRIF